MKYAVEMGSGAMIYIPSLINTGSGVQGGGIHRQTGRRLHKLILGKWAKNEVHRNIAT
jgi:hypothetical protein